MRWKGGGPELSKYLAKRMQGIGAASAEAQRRQEHARGARGAVRELEALEPVRRARGTGGLLGGTEHGVCRWGGDLAIIYSPAVPLLPTLEKLRPRHQVADHRTPHLPVLGARAPRSNLNATSRKVGNWAAESLLSSVREKSINNLHERHLSGNWKVYETTLCVA